MSTDQPRTVTVNTVDHGPVTFTCPPWCVADHQDCEARADILHCGPDVALVFRGHRITDAGLVQTPFSTAEIPELCSSTPGVSVSVIGRTLDPTGLYDLAAAMDGHADQLRDLADQLTALLEEGQ